MIGGPILSRLADCIPLDKIRNKAACNGADQSADNSGPKFIRVEKAGK